MLRGVEEFRAPTILVFCASQCETMMPQFRLPNARHKCSEFEKPLLAIDISSCREHIFRRNAVASYVKALYPCAWRSPTGLHICMLIQFYANDDLAVCVSAQAHICV